MSSTAVMDLSAPVGASLTGVTFTLLLAASDTSWLAAAVLLSASRTVQVMARAALVGLFEVLSKVMLRSAVW